MTVQPPDRDYLDAFLQGARFALFAVEARLRENDKLEDREVQAALEEFHELFESVREGVPSRKPLVELAPEYLGKN